VESLRTAQLRAIYPHEHGRALIPTTRIATIAEIPEWQVTRELKAAGTRPVRRGAHGIYLWRHADVAHILDRRMAASHAGDVEVCPKRATIP
jgi:hypothetical protein